MIPDELFLSAAGALVRSLLEELLAASFGHLQARLRHSAPRVFAWQSRRLAQNLPGSAPPAPSLKWGFCFAPRV
jgi:hypothetical protein